MIVAERDHFTTEELLLLAEEIGFSHAAELEPAKLRFRPEVREMCSADRCHNYGRSWSCPPALGSLEHIAERAGGFGRGILVQSSVKTQGEFDLDTIRDAFAAHTKRFDTLVRQIRRLHPGCLPMGSGGCRRCRVCTYPDRPCRHPDRLYPSMEAYGLLVSEVCLACGLQYNYGPQTMTYTACILVD